MTIKDLIKYLDGFEGNELVQVAESNSRTSDVKYLDDIHIGLNMNGIVIVGKASKSKKGKIVN